MLRSHADLGVQEFLDVVKEPKDVEADLDIVFVHGLNPRGDQNHARGTWTHQNGTFWPKDLLPELVPTARILLFAYNSSVLSDASNIPVAGHAQSLLARLDNKRGEEKTKHRPLVFIAHSLGGLVVKQALVEARINERRYGCIKASTHSLVFFATPHGGGNGAGIADFAARVYRTLRGEPSSSLLSNLKRNSVLNDMANSQFSHQVGDYEILTFFETKKMGSGLASVYVVDGTSAKLRVPRETALPLDAHHSEICKSSGLNDRVYQNVLGNLRRLANEARKFNVDCCHNPLGTQTVPGNNSSVSFTNSIPGAVPSHLAFRQGRHHVNLPKRCVPFIGRSGMLERLRESWAQDSIPQRRICLTGLGGIGKSELARQFVEELRSLPFVLWFRATNKETFRSDFDAAAWNLMPELRHLEIAQIQSGRSSEAQAFYHAPVDTNHLTSALEAWLRSFPDDERRILCVLDDLDGLEPSGLERLSHVFAAETLDLIYTTRDPLMAEGGMAWDATPLDLSPLETDDAVRVFQKSMSGNRAATWLDVLESSNRERPPDDVNRRAVECLGLVPAAIISAYHYTRDFLGRGTSQAGFQYILAEWADQQGRSRLLQAHREGMSYPHSVADSFAVSIARLERNTLKSEIVELFNWCVTILRLLSMMDIKNFRRARLLSFSKLLLGRAESLSPVLHTDQLRQDLTLIPACITQLERVSLVVDLDGVIGLNSLVKAAALMNSSNMKDSEYTILQPIAEFIKLNWNPLNDSD